MPKIRLDNARGAFLALFEPQAIGDGEPAYGGRIIIDPANKKMVAAIDAAIKQAAYDQPKWKGKEEAILAKIIRDGNCCFLKQDYTDKNGDPYAGFEGMYSLGTRSKVKPLVIDRDRSPLVASDGRPYSGCYNNWSLEIWAQDNSFGRRINCSSRASSSTATATALAAARRPARMTSKTWPTASTTSWKTIWPSSLAQALGSRPGPQPNS